MPLERVGPFTGHEVYGSGGEYRYDHTRRDLAVHVHRDPDPDSAAWAVSVDEEQTGGPGTVFRSPDRQEAFGYAYEWMEEYSGAGDMAEAGGDFDFTGGGL